MARGAEVGEEGARHDGRGPQESAEAGRVSGQAARRPAAVDPGRRLSVPHVPRRRPLPSHPGPARIVRRPASCLFIFNFARGCFSVPFFVFFFVVRLWIDGDVRFWIDISGKLMVILVGIDECRVLDSGFLSGVEVCVALCSVFGICCLRRL